MDTLINPCVVVRAAVRLWQRTVFGERANEARSTTVISHSLLFDSRIVLGVPVM